MEVTAPDRPNALRIRAGGVKRWSNGGSRIPSRLMCSGSQATERLAEYTGAISASEVEKAIRT